MPRATLSFKLPEEADDHKFAVNGKNWALAAWDLDQQLRNWLKYGSHGFKTPEEAMEAVRAHLRQILEGYSISLEDIT